MESSKFFIDTNIIIDLLDDTRKEHTNSKIFIQRCLSDDVFIAISDDIVTTVYYLLQKKIERKKLLLFIKFLSENFKIISFDKKTISKAIEICTQNITYDFEDTLQAVCAKQNDFQNILTNDKKFPKIQGINILDSSEVKL